jgi:hypothetical protein
MHPRFPQLCGKPRDLPFLSRQELSRNEDYSNPLRAGQTVPFEVHQSVNRYFTSAHSAGKPSLQEIFLPSL